MDGVESIKKWLGDPTLPTDRYLWCMRGCDFQAVREGSGWSTVGLMKALKRKGWRWSKDDGEYVATLKAAPCSVCGKSVTLNGFPRPYARVCSGCAT